MKTATATHTTPKSALRAAKALSDGGWLMKPDRASQKRIAEIIADETGLPDLLAACEALLPSRCQASHHASPNYRDGADCGKCPYCIGLAAIAKAKAASPP